MRYLPNKKALLLNFTANSYHWGCFGTSLAIFSNLCKFNYYVSTVDVEFTHHLKPSPSSLTDFTDNSFLSKFETENHTLIREIRSSDLVVINGEGTLHGVSSGSVNLLFLAFFTKKVLNKPTHLINHSCFPNSKGSNLKDNAIVKAYMSVIGMLDTVVPREEYSLKIYRSCGLNVTQGFDCLPFYIDQLGLTLSNKGTGNLILSGGITLSEESLILYSKFIRHATEQGLRVIFLTGAKTNNAKEDFIFYKKIKNLHPETELLEANSFLEWIDAIKNANYLLSGRFHHTIAAITTGTPFSTLSSNTPKVEAILELCGLKERLVDIKDSSSVSRALSEIKETITQPKLATSEELIRRLLKLGGGNFIFLAEELTPKRNFY